MKHERKLICITTVLILSQDGFWLLGGNVKDLDENKENKKMVSVLKSCSRKLCTASSFPDMYKLKLFRYRFHKSNVQQLLRY